nr:GNAT family N-acetyltransferase [uncultured Allomuricauda sp.]
MGLDIEILEVSNENYSSLSSFINGLGDEQNSFRYFRSRGQEALKNHLFTCLVLKNQTPVGYGHLDQENDIVWLGIVIKQEYQGLGFGKKIMQVLIDKGEAMGVRVIQLSVDNDNINALGLYKKHGFKIITQKEEYSILRRQSERVSKFRKTGISTLAFRGKSREEITSLAKKNNWLIEFSSSFPHLNDMEEFFVNANIRRLAHNYFPAPNEPFVLNLASLNKTIRERSIRHCFKGLEISSKAGAPCFSAHAGFCIDPDPKQLGKRLDVNIPIDREENWQLFVESVRIIVDKAKELGMSFYIENNVTADFNLRDDGEEVLFCSRDKEMISLYNEINSDGFGLLLDTAHLKVSSLALEFDINEAMEKLKPYIKYLHHSDNDGRRDTNESIDASYWFLPWMKEFENSIHILEVNNIGEDQIKKQLMLLNTNDKRENTYL